MLYYILLLLGFSYEATSSSGITDTSFINVQGCQLPDYPTNGNYNILHSDHKMSPGDLAERYTILIYSCDTDFHLTAPSSVCTSENTWSTAPECNNEATSSSEITDDTLFKNFRGNGIHGCQLPDHPTNGSYNILHSDQKMSPGDLAERYTILIFSCDTDFDVTAPASVCTSENTWSTVPECNKRCSMVSSSSVNFECFSPRGIGTACSATLPSGSVVLSSCKEGHVFLGRDIAVLTCRNGHWDEDTPACHTDSTAALHESLQEKVAELVAQNVILENTLQEFNISVREQLSIISSSQADTVQEYLLQDIKQNILRGSLEMQKQENSKLRAQVESSKTSLMQEMAKKMADYSKLLKSELDSLKSAQTQEVTKLNSEISKWKTELDSLENEQTKLVIKQMADILLQLRSELDLLKSAQLVEAAEQKQENSKSRAQVESLKTSLMQETAKKMTDHSQLLKSELDSLKSAQTLEVAKLNSEISKWKTDLESLMSAQTQLITEQRADILQQLRSELDLLKSAQSVEAAEKKQENSKLSAEVESLKTSLMQETAKKMADHSQLLKSELDSLKSVQTQEVAKLTSEISKWKTDLESLKNTQTKLITEQRADILQNLRSELNFLKSAQSVEAAERKQENSKLRAEVESLKKSLMQETAKKMADHSQLLKSELDSLKSAQTQEVAKQNSETTKLNTELELLKSVQTLLISKSLPLPHTVLIPGEVQPGWSVTVSGMVLANAHYFTLDFTYQGSNCIGFHFKPYFPPHHIHIVRNHMKDGAWGNEETGGINPLSHSQPFNLTVTAESSGLKVDINYKYFCHFNHRLPYQGMRNLIIAGDVILFSASVK